MSQPRKRRGDRTIYDEPEMREIKERNEQLAAWGMSLLARKMRCDSIWKRLNEDQCLAVEGWLFEENLTYAQTAERVKREFSIETTVSSMGRLYRYLAQTRQRIELLDSSAYAGHANRMPGTTGEMREATVKLLAASAVRRATEKPDEVEQLLPVAKALLASEENEIRLRRVKLAEEAFDFESAMARGREMEKVRAYVQEIETSRHLNEQEKQERIEAVKKFLFEPDQNGAQGTEDAGHDNEEEEEKELEPATDESEQDYLRSEREESSNGGLQKEGGQTASGEANGLSE